MEILALAKILRQYWKLIVLLGVLGFGLGLYATLSQAKLYEANTRVTINLTDPLDQNTNTDFIARRTYLDTVITISTSETALQDLATLNGLAYKDFRDLRQAIKVYQINESEFLGIVVRTPSQSLSIKLANDMANLLSQTSATVKRNQIAALIQDKQNQLEAAKDEYKRLLNESNKLSGQYEETLANQQKKQVVYYNQQLELAQNNFKQARELFENAVNERPQNVINIELARNKLLETLNYLNSLTSISSAPYDQAVTAYELMQASTLTNALEDTKIAKEKVDSVQAQIDRLKQVEQFITDKTSGITVIEPSNYAGLVNSSPALYLGLPLGVGLGIFLAVILSFFFDPGIEHLFGASGKLYVAYIPLSSSQARGRGRNRRKQKTGAGVNTFAANEAEEIRHLANTVLAKYHESYSLSTAALPLISEQNELELAEVGQHYETGQWKGGALATLEIPVVEVKSDPLRIALVNRSKPGLQTRLAVQLSLNLAQTGYRVLLLNLGEASPVLVEELGLTETARLNQGEVNETAYPGLDVVTYETDPFLSGKKTAISDQEETFNRLLSFYQIVIFNGSVPEQPETLSPITHYFQHVMLLTPARKLEIARTAKIAKQGLSEKQTVDWVVVDALPPAKPQPKRSRIAALPSFFELSYVKAAIVILIGLVVPGLIIQIGQPKEALTLAAALLALPIGLVLFLNPRLSLWILLVLANFLFFFNRFVPQVPMGLALEGLILVSTLGTLYKAYLQRKWPRSNLPVTLKAGLVIYSVYCAFQVVNPNSPGIVNNFYGFRWLLLPVLLPWLTSIWLGNGRDIRRFFRLWLGLEVCIMAYGAWQQGVPGGSYRFTSAEWDWLAVSPQHILGDTIRIFGTLGSADAMGMYMVMALILALGLLGTNNLIPRQFKFFLVLLMPAAIVVMLWTLTRSAYAGLPIGLIVITVLTRNRWLVIITLLLFSLYGFLAVTGLGHNNTYIARFFTLTNVENDDSYEVRQAIQDRVIGNVFSNPIGNGPNTTGEAGAKTLALVGGDLSDAELAGTATDNYYLRIGLETGWLGVLAFIVLAVSVIVTILISFRKAKSSTARHLLAIFLAVLGAMLFGSWANNYFQYPPLTQLFFMSMGLLGPLSQISETALKPAQEDLATDPWATNRGGE